MPMQLIELMVLWSVSELLMDREITTGYHTITMRLDRADAIAMAKDVWQKTNLKNLWNTSNNLADSHPT